MEDNNQLVPVQPSLPAKRLTKKKAVKLQEKFYLENLQPLLETFYPALQKRLSIGDDKALKLFAEIVKLVGPSNGVTINNNNIQQNNGGGGRDRGFESIIRKLDARDAERSRQSDIQEAEFEDIA